MSKMTNEKAISEPPPTFDTMVRENSPITLGAARAYAQKLPSDQQKHPCCACYKVRSPTNSCCCKDRCVGLSCHLKLGNCLWYCWPWMCACNDKREPSIYSCSDLKGNTYKIVKVSGSRRGKWACFTENALASSKGDDLEVGCYFE
jgi:hypothetical protein